MSSEGCDTLVLPFTSKMGQSVAQNRQNIFLFGLYYLRDYYRKTTAESGLNNSVDKRLTLRGRGGGWYCVFYLLQRLTLFFGGSKVLNLLFCFGGVGTFPTIF